MLKKGAIQKTSVEKCQFLSKLFLVVRKNGGSRPVISIKNMNASILYLYFKMEGLHLLKFMLKVKNYMCKIELKNAYICNPLHWQHQKYIRFCWEGQFYEFVYPCFGLGQAPRFLTKLLKISIAKNNIPTIVYLDDMFLMSQTIESLNMVRDTLTFLFHQQGFIINLFKNKKFNSEMQKFDGKFQANIVGNYKIDRFTLLITTSWDAGIFTKKDICNNNKWNIQKQ